LTARKQPLARPASLRRTGGGWQPLLRLPASPAAGWRWAAWVARLAGRRATGTPAWDRLALLLRTGSTGAPLAITNVSVRREPRVSVPWSLHLTLRPVVAAARHALTPSPVPVAAAAVSSPVETHKIPVPTPTLPLAASPALPPTVRAAGELVVRLLQREREVIGRESRLVERVLARQGLSATAVALVPPVSRVFHQPAASQPAAAVQSAAPAPALAAQFWESTPRPSAPAPDVERLTDQVICSLDQRVTAARERLGKR
jgi:hypothetical protein